MKAGEPFYASLAGRLDQTAEVTPTVRLDLPKPPPGQRAASALDLLPPYWKVSAQPAPTDLSAADGLQDVRERLWSEENGFATAEFTVTPEATFALLERGLPFLLTMVDAGYSHSQLAVGCDRARDSVWLTDDADRR